MEVEVAVAVGVEKHRRHVFAVRVSIERCETVDDETFLLGEVEPPGDSLGSSEVKVVVPVAIDVAPGVARAELRMLRRQKGLAGVVVERPLGVLDPMQLLRFGKERLPPRGAAFAKRLGVRGFRLRNGV